MVNEAVYLALQLLVQLLHNTARDDAIRHGTLTPCADRQNATTAAAAGNDKANSPLQMS